MISLVEVPLLIILGFFLLYLALLSLLALVPRLASDFSARQTRNFAIVVPAHNEELVVERTLRSLLSVDYPREAFEVFVVADNCSDRTAPIARESGAVVLERRDNLQKGKGYALRWSFDRILASPRNYEAVVVVDADTVMSRDFLKAANFYLERGAEVIQAADIVEPQPGSWSPEVTRIALTLNNYVRPLGRRVFGFSAGLRGNGMCFSTAALKRIPWNAYSITEDLEYGLTLLLNGVRVVFAPEAVVYAKMPTDAKNAESQRARWESGRYPIIRQYAGLLLRAAARGLSFPALDALIDLITPAFVNMVFVVFALLALTAVLAVLGVAGAGQLLAGWAALAVLAIVHVLAGLIAARADREMYKTLFYLPRYAAWKVLLYAKLLARGGPKNWIRTTRETVNIQHATIAMSDVVEPSSLQKGGSGEESAGH